MALELPNDSLEFLKLLSDHHVEYLLIGGYAVGYYGYPLLRLSPVQRNPSPSVQAILSPGCA